MRTLGIIVATAIVTALLTSAAWVFLNNQERPSAEAPPPSTGTKPVPEPAPLPNLPPEIEAQSDDMVFRPTAPATSDLMAKDLVFPVRGYDPADLTPQFDDGRSGGRAHQAIDLMAARGNAGAGRR